MKYFVPNVIAVLFCTYSFAQTQQMVKLIPSSTENKVDVYIGKKIFTSFLYPGSLEKPVLYPLNTASGTEVTRGFPLHPLPGDPTDHPHHIGMWFNFENVNGLDFWNNSSAIAKERKHLYGWIKTTGIPEISGGKKGTLTYHANWTNQQNDILLYETTSFEFSGSGNRRIIDRVTVLKANTDVLFTDVKDGMLGIRLAHALQMPTKEDQKFTDNKGSITFVKGGTDTIPTGNYLSSEGKTGIEVWSTRGRWCKVYGKMGNDSVTVAIIDHPQNPNYPTFWHARGYGLFAANPLGEKIFTNGKSFKNLHLKKDESVSFRYRIIIDNNNETLPAVKLNRLAAEFAKQR
jgi:Methane oxygenase PmoA